MTEPTPSSSPANAPSAPAPSATAPSVTAPGDPHRCPACQTPLEASARFCHHCGAALGAAGGGTIEGDEFHDQPLVTGSRGLAASLPWLIAIVGLIGGSAYVAGRSDAQPTAAADGNAPFAAAAGAPNGGGMPNIAAMSPSERANRLYGRIMQYVMAGRADSAAFFAPMALAAHEMLESPTTDERYHLGQINEMIGNASAARAQADTILKTEPDNLLGLMLGSRAALLANKPMDAKPYNQRLVAVVEAQLASNRQEYATHRAEIDRAVKDAKAP